MGRFATSGREDQYCGAPEARDHNQRSCCCYPCLLPTAKDSVEFYSSLALFCVGVGAVLVCVGYFVPRDYQFDPHKPARQMEAIELYYSALAQRLDRTILAGLAFVASGVLLMAAIISVAICGEICAKPELEPLLDMEMDSLDGTAIRKYGSSQQSKGEPPSKHLQ